MFNIILKSFDGSQYDNPFIELALEGLEIGTCISVANEGWELPKIDCKNHIHIEARNMREGNYDHVDWNTIPPLDEELIQNMRNTEAVFLTMVQRYAIHKDYSYGERKQQYLQHLRYWNHILDTHHIDVLLLNHAPHQCYDYVLYDLCKLKGIATLHLERRKSMDVFFVFDDWETAGSDIRKRYEELLEQCSNSDTEVPLSNDYEEYFKLHVEQNTEPFYMDIAKKYFKPESFARKWTERAWRTLCKNPKQLLVAVFSYKSWTEKLAQQKTARMYFRHAKTPDLNKPFVYVPLHVQPEMTTSPLAGAFVDQELMIQLLASCLPSDINIYVKEHPAQDDRCRSVEFYQTLLDIPSVTFVSKETNTFDLMENAVAVASATGTAAFQAIYRQTPAIIFGHTFFQYAPGIHPVRTVEDCQKAVDRIFDKKEKPSLRELRIYMKAIEECGTVRTGPPESPNKKYSQDEKAVLMGKRIGKAIRELDVAKA